MKFKVDRKLQQRLAYCVMALAGALSIYVSFTFDFRGHYSGDNTSSDAVWLGGLNFYEQGFTKLSFVPVQEVKVSDLKPGQTIPYYTHYPAGNDIFQGALFYLGLHSRFSHQMVGLMISLLGAFFCFRSLVLLFDFIPAFYAFCFFLFSPSFILWADSIHGYSWLFFFRWYYLFWLIEIVKKKKSLQTLPTFFKLLGFGLLASWFSMDPIPQLLAMGIILFFALPLRQGILLGCAAVVGECLGFLLHTLKNGLVLGGAANAFADLRDAFLLRGGYSGELARLQGAPVYDSLKHFGKYILGIHWFYTYGFVLLALVGWLVAHRKKNSSWTLPVQGTFIALVIGTLFWQVAMKQHAMVHALNIRHIEVFLVLGVALWAQRYLARFRKTAVFIFVLLMMHTGLAIAQNELTPVKKYFLTALVSAENRAAWSCSQKNAVFASMELHGAKSILTEWLPEDCTKMSPASTNPLAQLILFWR